MPSIWRFTIEIAEPGVASCSAIIEDDEFNEGQLRAAIQSGKHSSYNFEGDASKPKVLGRILYKEKVHVASYRAENRSIRGKIKELKEIQKKTESEEKKAEKKANFKEKK